jgi:hypothetical protein
MGTVVVILHIDTVAAIPLFDIDCTVQILVQQAPNVQKPWVVTNSSDPLARMISLILDYACRCCLSL